MKSEEPETEPCTSSFAFGLVAPMPTLPSMIAPLAGAALFTAALTLAILVPIRRYAARLGPALRLGASTLTRRRGLSLVQSCAISLGLTALLLLAVVAPSLLDNW